MADIIKLLPDHVANQIAAGEVVQRPASVVKELLENAIDAGATHIKLIVKDGGKALIQVIDNGMGMSETDARLAFERHATSKISKAEDLFNLSTKGFRGEALASIAAIAHVELHTKADGADLGTCLKIEGSTVVSQDVTVTPTGSSVSVKNLFFNIPARRNFLKSNQVELRHITDEFHRVALVHYQVSFQYFNNGSELFNLPKGNFRQRIVHVFGNKMNERLVPVSEETDVVKISGFVCKPEYARKSRGEQFFFANGRFIKSPYLHHAVGAAFDGLLKPNCHPGYFLFLEVAPTTIDINIHPTKTEVKFDDEHTLYAILRSTVKHSLGQFNVAPVLDFERDGNLDTPYGYQLKEAALPKVGVDIAFNPFEPGTAKRVSGNNKKFQKQQVKGWEALYQDTDTDQEHFSSVQFETEPMHQDIFGADEEAVGHQQATFQMQKRFIVTTIKSGMLVVDQNRAHKRVLYERLLQRISAVSPVSQQLLFPVTLSLTTNELDIIARVQQNLIAMGFVMEPLEDGIRVTGIPSVIAEQSVEEVFHALVRDYENELAPHNAPTNITAAILCKTLCIKNGQVLEPESQIALVNDLFGCDEPKIDPFGRTTFVTLDVNEVANKFM
ncbi:DNA mismatch repair protein MutL [Croceitalea dokdonensis DOKDO 023]|uniref:DNA mismatch repair protein MutL n=1 Tax=Croceitalea dokdonensis DOKDO 023 TaxID=1300341 RepID=A0A0N8H3W2_9FLAO|nr:DNA mismatch repair endonuclease MutL [Croceitalea dokdonensis]KPM31684.1 DNA mismatch repair protein MutL [Croceitalea dokdonensis DOKDO 023]